MISFRLTDEEYDRFRSLCISRGLRNVSELVRAAVNQLVTQLPPEPDPPPAEVSTRIANLESRLAELATTVYQIQSGFAPHPRPNHSDPVPFAQANSQ